MACVIWLPFSNKQFWWKFEEVGLVFSFLWMPDTSFDPLLMEPFKQRTFLLCKLKKKKNERKKEILLYLSWKINCMLNLRIIRNFNIHKCLWATLVMPCILKGKGTRNREAWPKAEKAAGTSTRNQANLTTASKLLSSRKNLSKNSS